MIQQALSQILDDVQDTREKLIACISLLGEVQFITEDLDPVTSLEDCKALSEAMDLLRQKFGTNEFTIGSTEAVNRIILRYSQLPEEIQSNVLQSVFYDSGGTEHVRDFVKWCDSTIESTTDQYVSVIDVGFVNVKGEVKKLSETVSLLDEALGIQNVMGTISDMASNGVYDPAIIVSQLDSLKNNANSQAGNVISLIRSIPSENLKDAKSWLSFLKAYYDELNSAHTDENDDIQFNTEDYAPKFGWVSIVGGAIKAVGVLMMMIGGAITKVVGAITTAVVSLVGMLWSSEVDTRLNYDSTDFCFGQPLGMYKSFSVNGFAYGTLTIQNRIIQVCSPLFNRFCWSNDGSSVNAELYARISLGLNQCKYIAKNICGIYDFASDTIPMKSLPVSYKTAIDYMVESGGYLAPQELLEVNEDTRRKIVMCNILLAWFFAMPGSKQEINLAPTYNQSVSTLSNIGNLFKRVYKGISWDVFYSEILDLLKEDNSWAFDVDPTDDIDSTEVFIIKGKMLDRSRPFALPPKDSMRALVLSAILAVTVIAATSIAAKAVTKKVVNWRTKRAIARRHQLEESFSSLKTASKQFESGIIDKKTFDGIYNHYSKQVRKYNFWAKMSGMAAVDAVTTYDLVSTSNSPALDLINSSLNSPSSSAASNLSIIYKAVTGQDL